MNPLRQHRQTFCHQETFSSFQLSEAKCDWSYGNCGQQKWILKKSIHVVREVFRKKEFRIFLRKYLKNLLAGTF